MQMKDGACNITGDGTSLHGWCTATTQEGNCRHVIFQECWNIPLFPQSWALAVGGKIFRVMINWHMIAMRKGATQGELNKEFALIAEIVNLKLYPANFQKSHRSRGTDGSEDVEMTEEEKNETPANEVEVQNYLRESTSIW